jgi:hypothetical protein
VLCCIQVKELLQANKPVRDAEWTAKEVSLAVATTRLQSTHRAGVGQPVLWGVSAVLSCYSWVRCGSDWPVC